MKNIVTTAFLMALLTLVSCNSENAGIKKSSKSKSCTYNNVPVDCKTFESQTSQTKFSIVSKVKTGITIGNNQLEILENTANVERKTKGGREYECQAFSNAGDIFDIEILNNKLQLIKDLYVFPYGRIEGKEGVVGKWGSVVKESTGLTATTLTIFKDSMEIIVECHFDK